MQGLLPGVHLVGKTLLAAFLAKSYLASRRVITDLHNVPSCECKGLEFAVVFHLVAVPRVSVRTNQVIAMIRVGVDELEVCSLDAVEVGYSYPYPRGQLRHLDPPLLDASVVCVSLRLLVRAGSRSIIR